jgi:DNA-binding XRE family transcriptional regulator
MKQPLTLLREGRCMLQRELAEKAGVAVRTVCAAETNHYPLSISTRRKILAALEVSVAEHWIIFGRLPDKRGPKRREDLE